MLEDKEISISGSSKPASARLYQQLQVLPIHTQFANSEVLVVNSGPNDIQGAFEKLPEGAQLDAWLQIAEFIRSNQGSKRRDQHG